RGRPDVLRDRRTRPRKAALAGALDDPLEHLGGLQTGSPRRAHRGHSFRAPWEFVKGVLWTAGSIMWEISQETTVAAAHQLRFAPGEGERLHGHNWRIKAVLRASELD